MDKLSDRARDRLRIPATVTGSIGTAALAILMVGVVTFGATAIRPSTTAERADRATTSAADRASGTLGSGDRSDDGDAPQQAQPDQAPKQIDVIDGGPGDEHPWQPKDEPKDEPAETDKPDASEPPKDEPKDEPKDQPKPDPTKPPADTTKLGLEAWVKEGKVKGHWSAFTADGFEYYKLVRSTDEKVLWPMGGNDTLLAAIGDRSATYFADYPPCGIKVFYRVFAVRHAEDGYRVLAASNVARALLECHDPEPPAEPVILGLDVWVTDAGAVKLAWEPCSSEDFAAYKIVRSAVHENPTFPLNDGTELVAAIGDKGATTFQDTNVEPGQTWTYRVYAMAQGGDGWVVLGRSHAKSVTVE